jgi:hypothetical protein
MSFLWWIIGGIFLLAIIEGLREWYTSWRDRYRSVNR